MHWLVTGCHHIDLQVSNGFDQTGTADEWYTVLSDGLVTFYDSVEDTLNSSKCKVINILKLPRVLYLTSYVCKYVFTSYHDQINIPQRKKDFIRTLAIRERLVYIAGNGFFQ